MSGAVQAIWNTCPTATRLLVIAYPALSIGLALSSVVLPGIEVILPSCSVWTVFRRGFFWAVPFSFLYRPLSFGPQVLFMLLEIYMAMTSLSPREHALGSAPFLAWLAIANSIVNIVFLGLTFVLSNISPLLIMAPIQGLWPVIILCMTMRSLKSPDDHTNFWNLIQVPNKWFPLFLAGLMCLLSGTIMWDFVAALAIGYGHERLRIENLVIGRRWVQVLENRVCCFQRLASRVGGSWVPSGGSPMADPESGIFAGGSSSTGFSSFGSGGRPGAEKPKYQVFQGTGQRLGSS